MFPPPPAMSQYSVLMSGLGPGLGLGLGPGLGLGLGIGLGLGLGIGLGLGLGSPSWWKQSWFYNPVLGPKMGQKWVKNALFQSSS